MAQLTEKKNDKAAASDGVSSYDNEDFFLLEVLRAYTFWKLQAAKVKRAGANPAKEQSYVEAYRLLLHQFTQVEEVENE